MDMASLHLLVGTTTISPPLPQVNNIINTTTTINSNSNNILHATTNRIHTNSVITKNSPASTPSNT